MLDGVQRLLFALKPNDVWVGDHLLCKPPHRILKRCREKKHLTAFCPPMDTNTLVPMTLCGDHHIRLVQHKHCDLLGVNELVLGAPVQNLNKYGPVKRNLKKFFSPIMTSFAGLFLVIIWFIIGSNS
uniref:Uncharacterized protein n=1 Tax=Echeneis naucrates TaxID=173247 RepID=A0A665UTG8_ECHNA